MDRTDLDQLPPLVDVPTAAAILGIGRTLAYDLVKTDRWLFAEDGISEQSRQALAQVRAMLVDAQGSLKRVDELLKNAVDISANVKDGTQDLAKLRADIDDSVRKANDLLNDINRMWPFGSDADMKLP